MAKRLVTQAYSLTEEHIDALRLLGEQDGRRGASEALRAVLDRDPLVRALIDGKIAAEQPTAQRPERQPRDRIAS
jgi:hypothetical protein